MMMMMMMMVVMMMMMHHDKTLMEENGYSHNIRYNTMQQNQYRTKKKNTHAKLNNHMRLTIFTAKRDVFSSVFFSFKHISKLS